MGRKTKFSKEIAQKIYDAIVATGSLKASWQTAGIHASTFYAWQDKYPEFFEGVARSQSEFCRNRGQDFQSLAIEKLADRLENGETIRWEKTERRVRRVVCPDTNETLRLIEETIESRHVERRPTPRWAIERVIPKPVHDLDNLLAVAEEYGLTLVVKDADLFNRYLTDFSSQESNSSKGLSDETVAAIRAKILGMDDDYDE